MKAMANAAKSINAMFKDSSPYDAKAFKAAAETIRVHSGPCRRCSTVPAPRLAQKPAQASKPTVNSSTSWQKTLAPTRPRCLSQLTEIPTGLDPERGCKREMLWEADRSQERSMQREMQRQCPRNMLST